jgi:hypothetical protein
MLKTGRKAQVKQQQQNCVGRKFFIERHKMIWLNTVFWWKESFGLTVSDVMHLSYHLGVRKGIKNQFCKRNEKTGKKWLKIFLCRHREISVTPPEGLHSQERGVSLLYFQIYEPAMYTIQHNPARLYNCDDTGITIVQHKHAKILRLKDKRQTFSVQSVDQGSLVTFVNRMLPTG